MTPAAPYADRPLAVLESFIRTLAEIRALPETRV